MYPHIQSHSSRNEDTPLLAAGFFIFLLFPAVLLFFGCSSGSGISFYAPEKFLAQVQVNGVDITVEFTWDEKYGGSFDYRIYQSPCPLVSSADFTKAGVVSLTDCWITGNRFLWKYASGPDPTADGTLYYGLLARDTGGVTYPYLCAAIVNDAYTSTNPYVKTFGPGIGQVSYNVNLGPGNKKVYYVYSNTNSGTSSAPEIYPSRASVSGRGESLAAVSDSGRSPPVPAFGRKDKPEALNWKGPALEKARPFSGSRSVSPPSRNVAPDPAIDNKLFYLEDNTTDTVTATLRKAYGLDASGAEVTDNTALVVLNIYTANNDAYGSTANITDPMIDALADKFLQAGADNDIYDWVTEIFGAPWGGHSYAYLIAGSDTPAITILLVDIDNDEGNTSGSYTLGYFWSKDNYTTVSGSNKRLMFYLDAPLLAKLKDGDSNWEIDDPYPAEQVSTLAHEFQHMIHFYQKEVFRGGTSETWLNEMCSLAAEDFVADKLSIPGPRGVKLDGSSFRYTAGTGNDVTDSNRIIWFNYYADYSLTDWDNDSGITYGIAYAFGAYLARNYGGAPLFQKIVQSKYGGMDAVTVAIESLKSVELDTWDLLSRWGTAVLLSDEDSDAFSGDYKLNRSSGSAPYKGAFVDTKSYRLGSINHFIYPCKPDKNTAKYAPGPFLWGTSKYPHFPTTLEPVSNTYVLGSNTATGNFSATIVLPPGVGLTIVIKE